MTLEREPAGQHSCWGERRGSEPVRKKGNERRVEAQHSWPPALSLSGSDHMLAHAHTHFTGDGGAEAARKLK